MSYNHGIRIEEKSTLLPQPKLSKCSIPVVFGTAPIHLAEKPEANKLVYARDYNEAVKALGYSEDFEKYTLCQSMYAGFIKSKSAPIIFVNVLDPQKHYSEMAKTDYQVKDSQAIVKEEGLLLDSLVVEDGETKLNADVDYMASFDDEGSVLITLLKTGVNTVSVSGKKIDASKVTEADIIGSYNEETGAETGMELLRQVYPKFGEFPGMIVAPGFSKKKNVAAVMESKCEKINGVFSCMAVIDLDTAQATKYTDVEKAKKNMGASSKNTVLLWPMVKYGDSVLSYSAVYAANLQRTDAANDDVPAPCSNQALDIDAICLADGTEVVLDEVQANTLNGIGVVTAVNFNGFKTWGNNTACYPAIADPKDRWINCRRFFSWWENSFVTQYHERVDGNISVPMIESIVDDENIKGNSYKSEGKCAGAYIEFLKEDNSDIDILNGHVVFRMHLAPYTPAEDILNIFQFDADALEAEFSGGE